MEPYNIDKIDLKILRLLQLNARSVKSKIAEAVNLSEALCWRRVSQMEASGIITCYSALIDREKLGFKFQAIVQINAEISGPNTSQKFEKMISTLPQVVGFYSTVGDFNYVLQVATKTVADFHQFLEHRLKPHACIKRINSSVVLSTIKNGCNSILQPE